MGVKPWGRANRVLGAIAAVALGALAACSGRSLPEVPGGPTPGFFGGAAADEPRAALVAEAIRRR